MRKLNYYIYTLCFLSVITGCSEKQLNRPEVINTSAPGVVSGVTVKNTNGKAVISYTLPDDEDMAYVKAVYETSPGVPAEVLASRHTNTLTVDGFGDTLSHEVKLISVNSSAVASEPVSVTVKPLTPGYILAAQSLKVAPTFGGFTLDCTNPTGDDLAIIPMVDTAGDGSWVQTVGMDNVYSNDTAIFAAIHNQPSIERQYAFTVRDKWQHYSDTIVIPLTPVFEQQLDKSTWSTLTLPNDAKILNNGGWCYEYYMWDGNEHPNWPNTYFTEESATTPQTVTIDLGSAHTFSRFKLNPYKEIGNFYYVRGNPKDFEIWGSNQPDLSDPEPNIESNPTWTKLGTFHVVKPSGSPSQTETQADQQAAYDGWEFDFPAGLDAYRYVRIRQISNWQGTYFLCISEFTLWGD